MVLKNLKNKKPLVLFWEWFFEFVKPSCQKTSQENWSLISLRLGLIPCKFVQLLHNAQDKSLHIISYV
jgi:hypothetical protein